MSGWVWETRLSSQQRFCLKLTSRSPYIRITNGLYDGAPVAQLATASGAFPGTTFTGVSTNYTVPPRWVWSGTWLGVSPAPLPLRCSASLLYHASSRHLPCLQHRHLVCPAAPVWLRRVVASLDLPTSPWSHCIVCVRGCFTAGASQSSTSRSSVAPCVCCAFCVCFGRWWEEHYMGTIQNVLFTGE